MLKLGPVSPIGWSLAIVLWAVGCVGVWVWTTSYEFTTQARDNVNLLTRWPIGTRLELAKDRPTLLFFVHPRCPCTHASVSELERALAGLSESQLPKLIIVASSPPTAADAWRKTSVLRRLSTLPRTTTYWDIGGTECSRFGITTSGAAALFRPDGKLLFSGGVTSSRGHEGDSVGSDHLNAHLSQQPQAVEASTPVFGCRLCIDRSPQRPTTSQTAAHMAAPILEGAIQ